ncbi:hypothetical protein ACWGB8_20105 [Kitasatospora sp. NPDC054939]
MRFLFVHGTGVRREGYDPLFALVARRLGERFPGADVVPCYWGDDHGATLGAGGASVPGFPGLPAQPGPSAPSSGPADGADGADDWTLLIADPLCELRVLAELTGGDDGFAFPGTRHAGSDVAERLAGLAAPSGTGEETAAELAALLDATVLAGHLPAALHRIDSAEEFVRACEQAADPVAGAELTAATARALTAQLLAAAGADALCTGDERDRITELLADRLGGAARGPLGRAAAVLGTLGMRIAGQRLLDRKRGALTVGAAPALGDILRYQARGGPLRAFLTERITAAPGPTVVIGHSLGGIALVDCLALAAADGAALPGLELLVTVGSQAPFLHELGALHGLEPGAGLPAGFPAWLNVYDPRDLLGYRAAPVFPGDPRVTDREVSSRQPFPQCHSAYFKLDAVYEAIAGALRPAGGTAAGTATGPAAGAAG